VQKPEREVRVTTAKEFTAEILHLHGFKCAGTTFIWSLERATEGQLLYAESPGSGDRLDWRLVRGHLADLEDKPRAITSHLITLPPPGAVARMKVAFLREPMARIASAFRFTTTVQNSAPVVPFGKHLEQLLGSTLANYQTRHLSPQDQIDWIYRRGWAARPELIDLERDDLFVGLVERYDESIVALEAELEHRGQPIDLAYPQRFNTTVSDRGGEVEERHRSTAIGLALTELDMSLYRRAERRLEERLGELDDREKRLDDFRLRCDALLKSSPAVRIKPQNEWLTLPIQAQ
jgi:hypothetical protein